MVLLIEDSREYWLIQHNRLLNKHYSVLSHCQVSSFFLSGKAHEKGMPTFVRLCWVILVVEICNKFLYLKPELMV